MKAFLNGASLDLLPSQARGKGGEADVYQISPDLVVKVFKPPNHPDFTGSPEEQRAAVRRIEEHQKKLPAFPKGFPAKVVVPQGLLKDRTGSIIGYSMSFIGGAEPLFRFSQRDFRKGIGGDMIATIFRDLHATVAGVHKLGVIGDANDLNVLVRGTEAYIIDADSFQFGPFFSMMFTDKFVDPLLCDPNASGMMLVKPHNPNSDWYAFTVMLLQCLLFVGPYGGVFLPKDPKKAVPPPKRPLRRITVFHPEVRYPRPAIPYRVLPDDLLGHFQRVFEKDWRGTFPFDLLENLRWTTCSNCGMEHAKNLCPNCAQAAPAAIKQVVTIRGKVTVTRIFRTSGLILAAAFQNNEMRWLYHEGGGFCREDGSPVISGSLDPQIRYRIFNRATLLGKDNQVVTISPGQNPDRLAVNSFNVLPVFDSNGLYRYWIEPGGRLVRDGQFASEYIGDVLASQTLFWVGPKFGFGFYRAGQINVSFVFDAERRGINDTVKLPLFGGQLIDSTCVFADQRCWFFASVKKKSKVINYCSVVKPDGTVEASASAEQGDGSWLSSIRGKCAAGNLLFAPTDDGIVRVEIHNGQIDKTGEFPDTEPFVDSGSQLFAGAKEIYVVDQQEIKAIRIA